MKLLNVLSIVAAFVLAAPATSYAEWAYTAKNAHLRAGPAIDYPVVAILPAGTQISVEGCLSDYKWCDVIAGPDRGWVYAGNIVYSYEGADVPVLTYGSLIGLAIIPFIVSDYWDRYYHTYPWYRQRQYWFDRPRRGYGPVSPRPPVRTPPSKAPRIDRPPQAHPPGTPPRQAHSQPPRNVQPSPHVAPPAAGARPPRDPGPGREPRPPKDRGPGGR